MALKMEISADLAIGVLQIKHPLAEQAKKLPKQQ